MRRHDLSNATPGTITTSNSSGAISGVVPSGSGMSQTPGASSSSDEMRCKVISRGPHTRGTATMRPEAASAETRVEVSTSSGREAYTRTAPAAAISGIARTRAAAERLSRSRSTGASALRASRAAALTHALRSRRSIAPLRPNGRRRHGPDAPQYSRPSGRSGTAGLAYHVRGHQHRRCACSLQGYRPVGQASWVGRGQRGRDADDEGTRAGGFGSRTEHGLRRRPRRTCARGRRARLSLLLTATGTGADAGDRGAPGDRGAEGLADRGLEERPAGRRTLPPEVAARGE